MPHRRLAPLALVLLSAAATADVCRWTNPDGSRAFGDRPPPNVSASCAAPPAGAAPTKPATSALPRAPRYSTAEMEYNRQTAIRLLGSSNPEHQALGRELGRQLDAYERAVLDVGSATAAHEDAKRQAIINQRAIEREFSDLTR